MDNNFTNINNELISKLPTASYTAADVLAKLLTVDGSGSGLDADLFDGLNSTSYAKLASPTFTGTPSLPTGTVGVTQVAGDNSTKLATTAFTANGLTLKADQTYVDNNLSLKANLASPTFTGTPSLPTGTIGITQIAGDISTKLATTAFVDSAIDEWAIYGAAPNFISSNTFTLVGNQTTTFEIGRRLKFIVNAGTVYGTILSSVFGALTTITVVMDNSKVLDNGLNQVSYGLISTNNTSLPLSLVSSGFKNKIIGGDFSTNPWQRGTSFASAVGGLYYADRWVYNGNGTASVTVSKSLDAPTVVQAGQFTRHSLGVAVTTAQTTIAAGNAYNFRQTVEGLNAIEFGFGQAGTRFVTLSFWVKGAKVGIHCVSLVNADTTRSYVAEYSISVANTWEYKSITIPVDVTGTWLYDTGIGLNVRFALASGTTLQTTPNTWAAGNFQSTANQVNELDTVGNNFKIALVQLEAGTVATPFEIRSVGQELTLCQRYYEVVNLTVSSTGAFTVQVPYAVPKRAVPTLTLVSGSYASATISAQGVWGLRQDTNSTGASLAPTSASAEL